MARKQEQGINYFPLDVDFLSDTKIKILKAKYGTDGIMIWIYLLCAIYKEGYYVQADEDFRLIAAGELGFTQDKIEQVILFLLKRSMFDEQLFKSDDVLTSANIQERWLKAVESRAKKTPLTVGKYWLLKAEQTPPFVKCFQNDDSSEKKDLFSEKNGDNSEKNSQRKGKERKVNISTSISPTPWVTKEEIVEYCRAKKLRVDAVKFYSYYSRRNWTLKNGDLITDWRGLLERWNETEKKPETESKGSFETDDFFNAAVRRSYESGE